MTGPGAPGDAAEPANGPSRPVTQIRPVLDRMPVVIARTDATGLCDVFRGALLPVLGLRPEDGEGRVITEEWDDQPLRVQIFREALAGRHAEMLTTLAGRVLQTLGEPIVEEDGSVSGAFVLVLDVTASHEVAEARRREAEASRALLHQVLRSQDEERRRLAHDVHDDMIQVVAAAQIRMEMVRRHLANEPAVQAEVGRVAEALQGASARLRSLVFDLDPPSPADRSLVDSIADLAADLLEGTGVKVSVVGVLDPPPGDLQAAALHRIAHEALVNVRKHAAARTVEISLELNEGEYFLVVADDGVGLRHDEGRPGHLGLRSVRERAEAVGGGSELLARRGGGVELRAWVPQRIGVRGGEGMVARAPLAEIVESIGEAFLAVDASYRVVYMNRRAEEMIGVAPGGMLGHDIWRGVPTEFGVAFRATYEEALRTQQPRVVEAYFESWGRWLVNRVYPSRNGLTIFFDDVTEQRRTRSRIEDLDRQFAAFADIADVMVSGQSCEAALRSVWTRIVGSGGPETGCRMDLLGYSVGGPPGSDPSAAPAVTRDVTVDGRRIGRVLLWGDDVGSLEQAAHWLSVVLALRAKQAPSAVSDG